MPFAKTNDESTRGRTISPRRILVVEDDGSIRGFIVEALVLRGYVVDAAMDGAAAWDTLQLNRYDLLVTDNSMPKVTGIELLKLLHAAGRSLPAIMATATLPEEEFTRNPWLRPVTTILKPYTIPELLQAVKEVLHATGHERGQIGPPSIAGLNP